MPRIDIVQEVIEIDYPDHPLAHTRRRLNQAAVRLKRLRVPVDSAIASLN